MKTHYAAQQFYKIKSSLRLVYFVFFAIETCSPEEFHCAKHQPKCVPMTTVCDGHNDCVDGSDEVRCNTTSCPSYKWACADRNQCIYNSWRCDGEEDCNDGSDEKNCTTTSKCMRAFREIILHYVNFLLQPVFFFSEKYDKILIKFQNMSRKKGVQ